MNRQLASVQFVGGTNDDPDYVYYNADIINNTTADQLATGEAVLDPNIVFNEQRDAPILKDISKYNFSIVRFTMNGANLDLPLFIPSIREGTGQLNPNLTNYGLAVPYQQTFSATGVTIPDFVLGTKYYLNDLVLYTTNSHYYQCIASTSSGISTIPPVGNEYSSRSWTDLGTTPPAGVALTVLPKERFVQYATQDRNKILAPTPLSLANVKFKGQYIQFAQYQGGDIVSANANDIDPVTGQPTYIYNTNNGPFYQATTPTSIWSPIKTYSQYDLVIYNAETWYCCSPTGVLAGADPPSLYPPLGLGAKNWALGIPSSLTDGWDAGTTYNTGDVVIYGSTLYQSLVPPTPTPVPVDWTSAFPAGRYETVGTVVRYTSGGSSTYWTSLNPIGVAWNNTQTYNAGDIVAFRSRDGFTTDLYQAVNTNTGTPPYTFLLPSPNWTYPIKTPPTDSYNWSGPSGLTLVFPPPLAPTNQWVTTITTPLVPVDITTSPFWSLITTDLGLQQDLSSDYYWIYNYQTWIDLVNETILDPTNLTFAYNRDTTAQPSSCCMCDTYDAFITTWANVYGDLTNFPVGFQTLSGWLNLTAVPPQLQYDGQNGKFSILFDSDGYGQRLSIFTAGSGEGSPSTPPSFKLFMNTNMYNLFANFPFTYWNVGEFNWVYNYTNSANYYDGVLETGPFVVPLRYTYEIVVPNDGFKNVLNYALAPYSTYVPNGPSTPTPSQLNLQKIYWNTTQEQKSTDTLWSPISTIVFTTALMPIKPESTASPVTLGQNNIGNSQPTAQSAFTRIITDIALDLAQGGAGAYKSFIYYVPSAEYRLSDFLSSHQPLSGVDVQVFWKNRLNNQLYPIAMTNLSSVSFKLMFKKKGLLTKADDT